MSNPYNIQNISGNKIGDPIPTLSNELDEGYIWLEGAEVSKTAYGKLYEIYGDIYGTAENSENFVLPDLRDRVPWGSPDGTFGYLEPALPNISGVFSTAYSTNTSGIFTPPFSFQYENSKFGVAGSHYSGKCTLNLSAADPIYQDGATVLPPSFKGRWKTRYK